MTFLLWESKFATYSTNATILHILQISGRLNNFSICIIKVKPLTFVEKSVKLNQFLVLSEK